VDGGDEVTEVSPGVFEGARLRDAHPVLDLGGLKVPASFLARVDEALE
jgi:hypothetical protein